MMPFLPERAVTRFCAEQDGEVVQGMQQAFTGLRKAIVEPSSTRYGCTIEAFTRSEADEKKDSASVTFDDGEYQQRSSDKKDFDARIGMRSVAYFRTEDPNILLVASCPVKEHFWICKDYFQKLAKKTSECVKRLPQHIAKNRGPLVQSAVEALWPPTEEPAMATALDAILGTSQAIADLKNQIKQDALTNHHVLILGETGSGKELVARAIHQLSNRSCGPFETLNCGDYPDRDRLSGELFGYGPNSGLPNAALEGKPGRIEAANGGTFFLDEIGELPENVQPVLFRVIQERKLTRNYDALVRDVDVRFVAATNKGGQLRAELSSRVGKLVIKVPPLREHKEDIPLLAQHFIRTRDLPYQSYTLDDATIVELKKLDWRYNSVRELDNWIIEAGCSAHGDNDQFNARLCEKASEKCENPEIPRPPEPSLHSPGPPTGTPASVGSTFRNYDVELLKKGEAKDVARKLLEYAFAADQELRNMLQPAIVDKLSAVALEAKAHIAKNTSRARWAGAVAGRIAAGLVGQGVPIQQAKDIAVEVCKNASWGLTAWTSTADGAYSKAHTSNSSSSTGDS